MIFHSRISENKLQSYIVIPFYAIVHCIAKGWVAVLSHYLVLDREDAGYKSASLIEKKKLTLKGRPAQVASGFG